MTKFFDLDDLGECGICGGRAVYDSVLDLNICLQCGAHETAKGWQAKGRSSIAQRIKA
jgi:hypothetical protein